jgi:hypothetical protein
MFWNLYHPLSKSVIRSWKRLALQTVDEDDFHGDQKPLQKILKQGKLREQISSLQKEFAYGHGTVVKHFIRSKGHNEWKDRNEVDTIRMSRRKQAITDVCQKYPALGDQIERVKHATSQQLYTLNRSLLSVRLTTLGLYNTTSDACSKDV